MSLDNFKAKLRGGGARPNLFSVTVPFPIGTGGNTELASFMIKGASLPSSVIAPIPVPFRGRKLNVAGDRTFEPWTITVINDNNMEIRKAFERWMNLINGNVANVSAYVGDNSLRYYSNITVNQLDRNPVYGGGGATDIRPVRSYEIMGAFPTNISAIELNYETNDTIEEFTVELTYNYWTAINDGIS